MAKLFNRAKMTTSTTGTGTITLGSASNGFQSFADAGVANGDVVQYVIEEGSNFEIGTGTYTSSGTTLTRTPSESSNSDAAITLAGQATVSITAIAADMNRLQHDGSDKVTVSSTGASVTGNISVTGTVDGVDIATRDGVLTSTTTTANAALPKAGGTMTGAITFAAGQTFDGRDVSADGSKLDGIESGATADQTANEILTAIKTVDGSGSGLDADTLDGSHASAFLTGNQTITLSGDASGSGTTSINVTVANDSHTHDGRYYTETEADTRFLRGNTSDTMSGNLTVDNGTSSTISVICDDNGAAGVIARGGNQGTGYVEVAQSTSYGGGMYYNGDGSPSFASGETADTIGFYRLNNGTRTEVFYYANDNNTVTFNGSIAVGGTVDGRDVASDGTKLDGIESGADVTDTTNVVAALTAGTNVSIAANGTISSTDTNTTYSAGSGLDLSGTTFSVETDLRDGITYVGLDSGDYIQWSNNAWTRVVINGGERARFESDGDFHADGNVIAYSTTISDPRLKDNVQKVDGALDKIKQLNGYTFTYKADGVESAGVMSPEVKDVLPSAVKQSKLPLKTDDDTVYDIVQYDQLTALFIEAIKEQQRQIDELKAKLGDK